MMRILSIYLILAAFCLQSCTDSNKSPVKDPVQIPELQMLADQQLRYIELSGTPYERGFQHGTLLKDDIHALIKAFKLDMTETMKYFSGEDPDLEVMEPDAFIAKFMEKTDYLATLESLMPELLDELRGISEGSGIDFPTIFMHNLGDEYWFNTKNMLAHSCSSFGADKTSARGSLAAQNMDIPPFYHGYQTVVKITDYESDLEMMYLTIPGHLGITGMNNKSVSINCNTLMQLDYATTGVPVTFIVRGVVGSKTQTEALKFLKSVKHASGQNYMIGGPEQVYSMECSTNEVVEFRPFEEAPFTYHTNHPMSNTDYSADYLAALKKVNKTTDEGLRECQRIKSFEARFTANTENIDIESIKDVLRARDSESRDVVSNSNTYASVIYDLGVNPRMLIAPGKPHETEYITLDFK